MKNQYLKKLFDLSAIMRMLTYEEMQYEDNSLEYQMHCSEEIVMGQDAYIASSAPVYYDMVSAIPVPENPTAINKQSTLLTECDQAFSTNSWIHDDPSKWGTTSVVQWLMHICERRNLITDEVIPKFHNCSGFQLCSMTKVDYVNRDPVHGEIIHKSLQDELLSRGESTTSDHNTDSHYKQPYKVIGRKHGADKRNSKLWEFIRDLLLDPAYCPSHLKWEDRKEGVFRFVRSDEIARLWGGRKNNTKMNYEKLSRAMRYHYKSGYLEAVIGKRLVYKFGKNSHGWQQNETR